jgi:hypothetical protein
MSNILKLKTRNNKPNIIKKEGDILGDNRHYPPANKEWSNSIYAYNVNTLKLLPVANKVIISIIRGYFNLYSRRLEKLIKYPFLRKWMRRLSTTRVLVSKAELKHTSDKVVVTLYIYNRQEKYFINRIKKIFALKSEKNIDNFSKKIKLLKVKTLQFMFKIREDHNMLLKTLLWNKDNILKYEKNYFNIFMQKSLRKEMLYMYLKRAMYLNKFKFQNTYLLSLKTLIQKFYNKEVEFNLVTLKNYYLNSDLLTQVLTIKLRKRNNRISRVLSNSVGKLKLARMYKLHILREATAQHECQYSKNEVQNLIVKNLLEDEDKNYVETNNLYTDGLDKTLRNFFGITRQLESGLSLENAVLNTIKHKAVKGVRLEASGRLTKRITAARAIYKLKYKGNIRNTDSSLLQRSSVILRGNLRSNVQYSKTKSRTRIGSFGLKGWVSSL